MSLQSRIVGIVGCAGLTLGLYFHYEAYNSREKANQILAENPQLKRALQAREELTSNLYLTDIVESFSTEGMQNIRMNYSELVSRITLLNEEETARAAVEDYSRHTKKTADNMLKGFISTILLISSIPIYLTSKLKEGTIK